MKSKFFTAVLTALFIALSGLTLHYLPLLQAKFLDAETSASRLSLYGSKDYNSFLAIFRLDPLDKSFDVVSIHTDNEVYVFLVNVKHPGGAALYENMSAKLDKTVSVLVPYDRGDSRYTEDLEQTAAFLKAKGYQVQLKPLELLDFRSLVHAGHFDIVLLEKRSLS